jgi:hypothetical protein
MRKDAANFRGTTPRNPCRPVPHFNTTRDLDQVNGGERGNGYVMSLGFLEAASS